MYFKFVRMFGSFRKKQILVIIIATLQYSILTYSTFLFKDLLDSVQNMHFDLFMFMAIKITLLSIVVVFLGIATDYYWKDLTNSSIIFLRSKVFDSILKKNNRYFKETTIGNILTNIMDDVSLAAQSGSISAPMLVINSFRIFIVLVAMSILNKKLSVLVFFSGLVYFAVFNITNSSIRSASSLERKEYTNVFSDVQEKISAIEPIKIHNKEKFIAENFDLLCKNHLKRLNKLHFATSLGKGINNFFVVLFPVLILSVGSFMVLKKQMTVGEVVAFYGLIAFIVEPINNLSDYILGFQITLGMLGRVMNILEDENEISQGEDIDFVNKIEFRNVSFSYNEDKEILKSFSAGFYKKDIIAVMGRSGIGKSTLMNLLINFLEPTSGDIIINDTNLRSLNLKSYYKHISFLQQFPFLLKTTIEDNIVFGDMYSREKIDEAIRNSCLDEFVSKLPMGLKSDVSELGGNISGGEKQRLCLARELIRKTDIIILDEPTSALDEETEKTLIQSIDQYLSVNDSITFIVSHKKEILKICNKVIYFTDDGVKLLNLKNESDLKSFRAMNVND